MRVWCTLHAHGMLCIMWGQGLLHLHPTRYYACGCYFLPAAAAASPAGAADHGPSCSWSAALPRSARPVPAAAVQGGDMPVSMVPITVHGQAVVKDAPRRAQAVGPSSLPAPLQSQMALSCPLLLTTPCCNPANPHHKSTQHAVEWTSRQPPCPGIPFPYPSWHTASTPSLCSTS